MDENEETSRDDRRRDVLSEALLAAAFDGFTRASLEESAGGAGEAATLFPRGVSDLLRFWSAETDKAMIARTEEPDFAEMKIREKVPALVLARLDYLRSDKEAARRAAAWLALPMNAPLAHELSWAAADAKWRALGDKSLDFNYYSKRAILSGVWTATMARWFGDDDPQEEATKAFLAARIDNVMQFEKFKARAKPPFDVDDLIGALSRWRYR